MKLSWNHQSNHQTIDPPGTISISHPVPLYPLYERTLISLITQPLSRGSGDMSPVFYTLASLDSPTGLRGTTISTILLTKSGEKRVPRIRYHPGFLR